jgi:uncharacterized membrane protein
MILTDEHIKYIDTNLKFYGVASAELRGDLLDHMCTYIEEGDFSDFDTAYAEALKKFGGYTAMSGLQHETYLQVSFLKMIKRKKILYISSFVTVAVIIAGGLFKLFHWPGAMVLIFLGILSVIFIVTPLYFYQRFQSSKNKLYNHH